MTRPFTFGIVGAAGATGSVVVAELCKSSTAKILVAGRDLPRAQALARQFDGRVSAAKVDIFDSRSLADFCSKCSIVVNCAGPTIVVQDRVAQAALHAQCHYVNPGGFSLVKKRLLPNASQIADSGLCFVLSAGWVPGMSEVLPRCAEAQARTRMTGIDSVSMYFGDCSEWSTSALRDGVWYTRHSGHNSAGYFRNGKWTRASMSEAFPQINLGDPVGPACYCLFSTPELDDVGRSLDNCAFLAHAYLAGWQTVAAGALLRLVPLPQGLAIRLMRTLFSGRRLRVGGFVVARVVGGHGSQAFTVQITYDEQRQYWANGLVTALAARMISEGRGIQPGLNFLGSAVDPVAFVAELKKAGIDASTTFAELRVVPRRSSPAAAQ